MSSSPIVYNVWRRLADVWQKWSVRDRGTVLIAIPMASLLGFATLLLLLRGNAQEAATRVDHTQAVLRRSNQLLSDALSVETSVQGFYISQDAKFLQQYSQAGKEVMFKIEQLRQLVQDNPQQTARIIQIQQSTEQDLKALTAGLQPLGAATSTLSPQQIRKLLGESESVIGSLKQQLGTFEAEEQRLLNERQNHLSRQQYWSTAAIVICAISGLLSSLIALCVFRTLETNLQRRKHELVGNRDLISTIANNIVDGVITFDRDGEVKTMNAAAIEMFGLVPEEVSRQTIAQLFPEAPSAEPVTIYSLIESLGAGQRQRVQTMGVRSDGNFFPIEISISPIQTDSQWIALVQDITERQQAEATLWARANELAHLADVLAQTNADLSAKNRELSQFAYVASHDLKAPLRAISNLSAWIEEDLGEQIPTENHEQFRLLRGRVERMEALIGGLLEYSRVGSTDEQLEYVSIAILLNEVIDSVSIPPEFTIFVDENMPTLLTRRQRLRQVFFNLISNAVKHHDRDDGRVSISVVELGEFWEFSVTDDGPGIASQYHQKVFSIFQTLQARDKMENIGIGLSIAKKAVETEGGTIQVQSSVSEGSTFRFTWPRKLTPTLRESHFNPTGGQA